MYTVLPSTVPTIVWAISVKDRQAGSKDLVALCRPFPVRTGRFPQSKESMPFNIGNAPLSLLYRRDTRRLHERPSESCARVWLLSCYYPHSKRTEASS